MVTSEFLIKDVTAQYSSLIPYLFPEIGGSLTTPALFGALEAGDNHKSQKHDIFGFAILCAPAAHEPQDHKFSVFVLPKSRGKGVGGMLMNFIIQHARKLHVSSLVNLQPATNAIHHRMMLKHNFELVRKTIKFEFDIQTALSIFEVGKQKLLTKNRIPGDIEVRPYEETDQHEASRLCIEEFGALTIGHLRSLGIYDKGMINNHFARTFWQGQELLGAWGVAVDGDTAVFDPLLIAKNKRNTWAFTLIIHTVLESLAQANITKGEALVHADNKRIVSVMARVNAHQSAEIGAYRLSLVSANA